LTSWSGCLQQQGPSNNLIIIPSVSTLYTDNPKQLIASYYSSDDITIDAQPPQYTLPLDLLASSNLDDLDEVFTLSDQQKQLLSTNGFFIRAFRDETDVVEPYTYLKNHAIPIFVTSDTVLHLYHILFDQTLKGI
jgi:hypothetical protein